MQYTSASGINIVKPKQGFLENCSPESNSKERSNALRNRPLHSLRFFRHDAPANFFLRAFCAFSWPFTFLLRSWVGNYCFAGGYLSVAKKRKELGLFPGPEQKSFGGRCQAVARISDASSRCPNNADRISALRRETYCSTPSGKGLNTAGREAIPREERAPLVYETMR